MRPRPRPDTPRVKAPPGKPRCPSHLSKEAKAHFRELCRHLEAMGVLSTVDGPYLAAAATHYANFVQHTINGKVRLAQEAWHAYDNIAKRYPLTYEARTRAPAPANSENGDPLLLSLNRRREKIG